MEEMMLKDEVLILPTYTLTESLLMVRMSLVVYIDWMKVVIVEEAALTSQSESKETNHKLNQYMFITSSSRTMPSP